MRRIFFWFSFGLFVLIISSAVWIWTADLGLLKPQVEKWVTEKTGREFAIDGTFSVDLAQTSIVIAEDVRFANADWADEAQMVTVGRAEVHLDLWSLFKGPIVIDLIDVDDTSVHLAATDDGARNWALDIERGKSPQSRDSSAGPPVLLKRIDVDRVVAVLDSPRRSRPLRLNIESLDQVHREDDILELALNATLDDSPVTVRGEAGGWQNLLAASNIRFDVEGQLGTFEFAGKGWLDDLRQLRRPSFSFSAKGPHINDLLRMLGLEEKGEGDIDLGGALTAVANEPLSLSVKGNLGRMELEASGSFSDLQNLEQVDIDLLATAPDLSGLLGLFGIYQVREAPFMVRIDASRDGSSLVVNKAEMVFAEAQFDLSANLPRFPSLDDSRIKLAVNGPDIERFRYVTGLPGQAKGPFSIDFDVEVSPDGVELLHLDLETSLGEVEANGILGDAPDYIGSELELTIRSEDLSKLGNAYGVRLLPDKPIEISGSAVLTEDGLQTHGPLVGTVNEVRVALDGHFALQRGLLGSDFDFELEGPDLAILIGAFAAIDGIPDEPYDISGELEVRGDGYRFREVTGTLGASALQVDGLLVPRRGIDGSYFEFAANGPAFEEIIDEIGTLEVYPGDYALSGRFAMYEDRFSFDNIELDRERGDLSLDVEFGRPASRRWMQFDLRAGGSDIRTLFAGNERFDIAEAPFSVDIEAERDGPDWSFDKVDIGIGDVTITASGDIEFGDAASTTRFRFSGIIPDLSTIGTIDGYRMRPQPITWDATVTGGGGELRIDDLNAKLGESDINGSFHYVAGNIPEVDVKLDSESLILIPLLEEREFEYDPEPERSDGRLIPDIAIPFDAMKKLNAAVDITVGELERDRLHMTNVRLHADLRDGALMIRDTGFNARSGYLSARASVEPGEPEGRVKLEMIARDFALGMSDMNLDMAMTGDIDLNLASSGNDLRTLMGNADGIFVLDSRGGRLSGNRILHMLYGDLLDEVISTINPFYKSDPYTQFDCIVLPAQFVEGRVSGQPNAFFQTDRMRIATKSKIDLKTERIDVAVRTSPRRGLGISAGELLNPFVRITGTLARPRLVVDEQGILITGGAAVATGGLSILARGLWDRLNRSSEACAVTGEEARKLLGDQFPDFEPAAAE
jgi:uncharacterized protein involved in outer membrane biogenesis